MLVRRVPPALASATNRPSRAHGEPPGSWPPPSCCHYDRADQYSPTSRAAANQPCCYQPAADDANRHTRCTQPRRRPSVPCTCAKKLASSLSCSHASAAACSESACSKQPDRGFRRACVSTTASHSAYGGLGGRARMPRLLLVQRVQTDGRGERGCAAWLLVAGKLPPGVRARRGLGGRTQALAGGSLPAVARLSHAAPRAPRPQRLRAQDCAARVGRACDRAESRAAAAGAARATACRLG